MKFTLPLTSFGLALSAIPLSNTAAFSPIAHTIHTTTPLHHQPHASTTAIHAVPLTPEPEGGEELTKLSSYSSLLPESRMKNMGKCEDVDGGEEGDVYTFWLSAVADGDRIKKLRVETEKEASRKANFPGFRKGQIPPYAQPKMTMFAIQEAVIKTCEDSVKAYGLQSIQGSDGEVTVNEDMQQVCKGYKVGTDVAFTATYRGRFGEASPGSAGDVGGVGSEGSAMSAEEVVVDVEAS